MKEWVVDFAVRELIWTKWMKESYCQTLVVFFLVGSGRSLGCMPNFSLFNLVRG